MKEKEFLKMYKKEKKLKNLGEAKKKIDFFWSVFIEALRQNENITFKNWGKFEIKDVKSRRVKVPGKKELLQTISKRKLTFRCGNGLRDIINKEGEGNNE